MRKLLVSVLSIGLLATPVALAFAADETQTTPTEETVVPTLVSQDFRAEARDQFKQAVDRAEARERRQERRKEARIAARQAAAQEVATTESAPEPTESQPTTSGGGGAGGDLAGIRQCESGGDYSTDTGNGFYGAYQFDQSTWESVGGSGSPAQASPAEQDQRAQQLMQQSGSSPWPSCG